MSHLLLVMVGGAIGSGARHLTGRVMLSLCGPGFPWGTLIVNLAGGFAMGALAAWLAARGGGGEAARHLLGIGMLGGFTTFSAFSLDAAQMLQRGDHATALTYVLASVVGSVLALFAGLQLSRAFA